MFTVRSNETRRDRHIRYYCSTPLCAIDVAQSAPLILSAHINQNLRQQYGDTIEEMIHGK